MIDQAAHTGNDGVPTERSVMATKDYNAIAASKIRQPAVDRPPRILIYGRNKKGKTRFGATAPNVLMLDPEDGTDHETKTQPNVWPVESWDDVHECYMFLKSRHAKSPITGKQYEWVDLDGLTRIHNMSLRWVMNQEEERNLERKPGQVGKQDYGRAGEMTKGMLYNFHSLRHMGVIISAQERMREGQDDEADEDATNASFLFVPDLPNGVRSAVNSIVDLIGRIYTVNGDFKKKVRIGKTGEIREVEYTIQRRLWIGHHPQYDTGARSEFELPDYIPEPTVPKLIKVMREGKVS